MRHIRQSLFVLCGLLVVCSSAPSLAQLPPSWAVGTFRGRNQKYSLDVEITITSTGYVTRTIRKWNGGREYAEGTYYNGKLTFGKDIYFVERRIDGIRTTKEGDSSDVTLLRRVGGERPEEPRPPGEVPHWATGRFRGYNQKYNLDAEITIRPNGEARRTIWRRNGDRDTAEGTFNDGRLYFEGDAYEVVRRVDGIRTIKEEDRSDVTDLRRVDGGGRPDWPDGSVPAWMVGTFRGYNEWHRVQVELRIRADGDAVRYTWRRSTGRRDSVQGFYRNGRLTFGRDSYLVERTRDGIRITRIGNEDDVTNLRRDGDGRWDDDDSRPSREVPSWLVGTFRGYNSKYNLDVEITVSRSGRATRNVWKRGGGDRESIDGYYREGQLVFGQDRFDVDRRLEGIRTVKEGDDSDTTLLRRVR